MVPVPPASLILELEPKVGYSRCATLRYALFFFSSLFYSSAFIGSGGYGLVDYFFSSSTLLPFIVLASSQLG